MKEKIHQYCLEFIRQKLQESELRLSDAKTSFESETKSSAGDKHETGREMAREELRKVELNHAELMRIEHELKKINPQHQHDTVKPGSLIRTDKSQFYIASALGQINISGEIVFVISLHAPIAQLMLGKTVGDIVRFNGKTQKILEVN